MKQIDIIKAYSQQRCLIVDDMPDVRGALKRILVDFGVSAVDTAGTAEEAVELCELHSYDIVLADYNLGPGKNGQQLLEELQHYRLLRYTSLFVIITAEIASHIVIHALEHQPDEYLTKPITRDSLRPRLDQAFLKKQALLDINQALDEQRQDKAIELCREFIAKGARYVNDCRKILIELLCQQCEFAEAKAVLQAMSDERLPIWAKIAMARVHYELEEHEQAKQILKELIQENDRIIEAHDLLAAVYEAQDQHELAKDSLGDALNISPMSPLRQREMARVCHAVGDEKRSVIAYRAAVKHSKNSYQESPEDLLGLANGLLNLYKMDPDKSNAQAAGEALEVLKQLDKKYGRQQDIKLQGKIITADIYDFSGQEVPATKALDEAVSIHQALCENKLAVIAADTSLAIADALIRHGHHDEGERLLHQVAQANDDEELAMRIDRLLREPISKTGIQKAAQANRKGIALYEDGNYSKAINAFQEVLKELPNHIGLNLNLIQATIGLCKETELTGKYQKMLDGAFKRIGEVSEKSSHYSRYQYLYNAYLKNKGGT